jgi:DNA-binding CsgD family transcriptional regulator
MARLTHVDLEKVLGVVQNVSEARTRDEFSRVAVTELAGLVPSDALALNEVDPSTGRISYIAEPESFAAPPELDARLVALAEEHPLMRYYAMSGDGSAKRISDFWTQSEFHASSVYQEVYRHLGIEYQMTLALPAPQPVLVAMVAARSVKDFSERDRAVLNTLRPHLAQAWYNAKDQDHLRSLLRVATDAAVDGGANVIVLSDPPHELTPGALTALYRHFGRPTDTSPFPYRVQRWLERQRSLAAGPETLALPKPLRAGSRGARASLRYLAAQVDHPGALLLRTESPDQRQLDFETLGLTTREAEVVRCVVSGMTNAATGEALHMSAATVKKHLDNIYTKLGVRGRGPLTAFVLDISQR